MWVSIRIKFIAPVFLCLIIVMMTSLHRLNKIESTAFEQAVHARTTLVSEFGAASQSYVNEELRAATQTHTGEFILEAMSAPYVTRSLFEKFNAVVPDYIYRQPTLNPLNPINLADEFETSLIERLQINPDLEEIAGYRQRNGKEQYYVARPIKTQQACLQCHGRPDDAPAAITERYGRENGYHWRVGDIVSALMVYVPTTDLRKTQALITRSIFGTFGLLLLVLAALVCTLFDRLIYRRINCLGQAIKQRAVDPDSTLRLKDTSADEIGVISRQFNYMADSLEQAYQVLEDRVRDRTNKLTQTVQTLKRTQAKLVQSEKMSSLTQMVSGIAHEINNPASFIHGNLKHARNYAKTLINLINSFEQELPVAERSAELIEKIEESELAFLEKDMYQLLDSMDTGSERIRSIVESLRNFSRLDEASYKAVDVHEGIESALLLLRSRLEENAQHTAIQIIRDYDNTLPVIMCFPRQLNQAFLHLLNNAIDAVTSARDIPSKITIKTDQTATNYRICIADNGIGISAEVLPNIFDPFFTTKDIGKGTGLGLFVSHQIVVEVHGGELLCHSTPGQGTTMTIVLPL